MDHSGFTAEAICERLNQLFHPTSIGEGDRRDVECLVFRGSSGIRWIVPVERLADLSRVRWRPQKFTSRVGWRILRILASVPRLRTLFLDRCFFRFPADGWSLGEPGRQASPPFIYMGTPGPFQKLLLFFLHDGVTGLVVKIPMGSRATESIAREFSLCSALGSGSAGSVPRTGMFGGLLVQEYLELAQDFGPFTADHMAFLLSLRREGQTTIGRVWDLCVRSRSDSTMLDMGPLTPWIEARRNVPLPIVIMHGDFSPWNVMIEPSGRIRPLDWEHGALEGIPGFDLAHYHLKSMLIHPRAGDAPEISGRILEFIHGRVMEEYFDRINLAPAQRQACRVLVLAALLSFTASTSDAASIPRYQSLLSSCVLSRL